MAYATTGTDTTYRANRVVSAYYDDRSEAQRAVDRLVSLGVPHEHVRLIDGGHTSGTSGTTSSSDHSKGFFASLAEFFIPDEDQHSYAEGLRRGGFVVSARVDEAHYERALDIMDDDGTVDISEREQSWRSEGWTGYDSTRSDIAGTNPTGVAGIMSAGLAGGRGSETTSMSDRTMAGSQTGSQVGSTAGSTNLNDDGEVIPIVEENLRIGKRDVNHGRVRVRSYVIEEPVHEQVALRDEHVDVERRAVNRPVSAGDTLFQDRSIEMDEHGEEAVVSKDARVTEEVVVRKHATERTQDIEDKVRRTEVEVDDDRMTNSDTLRRG